MIPDKAEYDRNEYIADMDLIGMMNKEEEQEKESEVTTIGIHFMASPKEVENDSNS